jgi:hypothetical protein
MTLRPGQWTSISLGVYLSNPSLQGKRDAGYGRRQTRETKVVAYYTRPPKRAKTRSFPWEYVEGARCDE